jgi:SAM-dependent methyltransferase
MISVAGNVSPVMEWRHGQAEDLPFEDATFDVVVSQFGLNFFQDQQAALKEMSRVLVPSGNMVIAVFDSLVVNEPYGEIASIFERVVGTEVGEALRFPFGLGDPDGLRAIIETANVGSPAIKSETGSVTFPNVRAMVEADVFGWFPFAGIELDEQTLDAVVDEATRALAPYVQSSGALLFEIGIHIASLRGISSE